MTCPANEAGVKRIKSSSSEQAVNVSNIRLKSWPGPDSDSRLGPMSKEPW